MPAQINNRDARARNEASHLANITIGGAMQQTQLRTTQLGETGLEITRVGFGAWAIGGGGWEFGWGPQKDEQSIAAIQHALEQGINWIDTAAAYGFGRSEQIRSE